MAKDINRIKVVLVEKKRTNKWLAKRPCYCFKMVYKRFTTINRNFS